MCIHKNAECSIQTSVLWSQKWALFVAQLAVDATPLPPVAQGMAQPTCLNHNQFAPNKWSLGIQSIGLKIESRFVRKPSRFYQLNFAVSFLERKIVVLQHRPFRFILNLIDFHLSPQQLKMEGPWSLFLDAGFFRQKSSIKASKIQGRQYSPTL